MDRLVNSIRTGDGHSIEVGRNGDIFNNRSWYAACTCYWQSVPDTRAKAEHDAATHQRRVHGE